VVWAAAPCRDGRGRVGGAAGVPGGAVRLPRAPAGRPVGGPRRPAHGRAGSLAAPPEPGAGAPTGVGQRLRRPAPGSRPRRCAPRPAAAPADAGGAAALRRGRERLAPAGRHHQPGAGVPVPLPPPAGRPRPRRARVGLPVADPAQLGPRQLDGAGRRPTRAAGGDAHGRRGRAAYGAGGRATGGPTGRGPPGGLRRRLRCVRVHARLGGDPRRLAHPAAQQPPLLVRPRPHDGAPAGPPEAARGQVRPRRPGHPARPDRRAARHRRGLAYSGESDQLYRSLRSPRGERRPGGRAEERERPRKLTSFRWWGDWCRRECATAGPHRPPGPRRSATATGSSQWGHGPPGPTRRQKTLQSGQRCSPR
jgi:hypothetical protein